MASIVGMDLGFRNTGLVTVDVATYCVTDATTLTTKPEAKKQNLYKAPDDVRSCTEMASQVLRYIRQVEPRVLIAEIPHGGAKSHSGSRGMGIATGMLGAIAAAFPETPTLWLIPTQVRAALCGRASASKLDAQAVVLARTTYPWPTAQEHVLDAMAAVLAVMESDIIKLLRQ